MFSVTFASGLRLIYKPKDMGIDVAYNTLLVWLNAVGAPIALRPLPRAKPRYARVGRVHSSCALLRPGRNETIL